MFIQKKKTNINLNAWRQKAPTVLFFMPSWIKFKIVLQIVHLLGKKTVEWLVVIGRFVDSYKLSQIYVGIISEGNNMFCQHLPKWTIWKVDNLKLLRAFGTFVIL